MRYCQECGKEIPDEAKYCNFCGHRQTAMETQNDAEHSKIPEIDAAKLIADPPLQLHCPKCRSTNLQALLKGQDTIGEALFTAPNNGIGFAGFGSKTTHHYEWLCKNCGIRFPRIEELESKVHDLATAIVFSKWLLAIFLIATVVVIIIQQLHFLYITIPGSIILFIIWLYAKSTISLREAELYTFRTRCFD